MRYECYFCHIKTIEKLIYKFKPEPSQAEDLVYSVHVLLEENWDLLNPSLARNIYDVARKYLNHNNLFEEEKSSANDLLLNSYEYWKNVVRKSENPFAAAAKLPVVGNIIDYGSKSVKEDITGQLEACFRNSLKIDRTADLLNEIRKARSIMFLGDNAGEIVLDKIFIETVGHPNITYAVRGKPVINDVTIEDTRQVGIDEVCRVISNGFDAPSTLVEFCSEEFLWEFNKSDLVISKGQGNN